MALDLDLIVSWHRALANPIRLRIAYLIAQGPLSVSDVQKILGLAEPATSKHLAYLHKCGLVERSRAGNKVFYRFPENSGAEHVLLVGYLKQLALHVSSLKEDERTLGNKRAYLHASEAQLRLTSCPRAVNADVQPKGTNRSKSLLFHSGDDYVD